MHNILVYDRLSDCTDPIRQPGFVLNNSKHIYDVKVSLHQHKHGVLLINLNELV
jgi:hypothetical protein